MSDKARLDQAISIAHSFFLGEEPWRWSDCDIVSTADSLSEASGLGADDIKTVLFTERDLRTAGRSGAEAAPL
jgi:hypothetical protein